MLNNIGNSILFLSVFLSFVIIYYIKNLKSVNKCYKNIYQLCLLQSTFVIISFYVSSRFFNFVFFDFSLSKLTYIQPTLYKIAGTWGNHEGLLLWVLILTLFSYFLNVNKDHLKNYRIFTLIFQNILILGFYFFII